MTLLVNMCLFFNLFWNICFLVHFIEYFRKRKFLFFDVVDSGLNLSLLLSLWIFCLEAIPNFLLLNTGTLSLGNEGRKLLSGKQVTFVNVLIFNICKT